MQALEHKEVTSIHHGSVNIANKLGEYTAIPNEQITTVTKNIGVPSIVCVDSITFFVIFCLDGFISTHF